MSDQYDQLRNATPKYVQIDLGQIIKELGDHYDRSMKDEYTGWCDCGEEVAQSQSRCETCGTVVIWLGSPAWKELYGLPNKMKQRLSAVKIDLDDVAGRLLMTKAHQAGFKNKTEYERWRVARAALSESELINVVKYCYQKGDRRRGLIAHVLNLASDKADLAPIREQSREGWL